MRHRSRSYGPAGLLFALLLFSSVVAAQAQEARPRSLQERIQPIRTVATAQMPTVDNRVLQARHPRPIGGGPLRFAEPLATAIDAADRATWETLPDGTLLGRLRIRSDDARSLSVGITRFRMPPGGALYVYAPGYRDVRGPFTTDDNEAHGQLWTPLVRSDELILEVTLPATRRSALQLHIGQVNHGFRSITRSAAKSASGSCNVDVACQQADPWRTQLRAVGRYTTSAGVLCTGTLVNNTADDRTPYFLTANHCGITPANAPSVVVYWNFQNSYCRPAGEAGGRGDGTLDQFSTGALYRASYSGPTPGIPGGPDFALVELDAPIEADFNVRYAGWSRIDAPPQASATIHHPQGQEKRIALDFDAATVTSYLETDTTDAPTHIRVANWDVGVTEPGSSGAPLFNANKRLVGVLSGGFAACALSDSTDDNDAPDWYGRLARAWTGGGTRATSLQPWLDPFGTNPVRWAGIDPELDTTPPSPITAFRVETVSTNGVTLHWTAPGDDGFIGAAAQYELRYARTPIRNASDFAEATVVSNLPTPQSSGAMEQFTVRGLSTNTPYYFALRARDNVNNASPLAATTTNAVILQDAFLLRAAAPNPFRAATTVGFAMRAPRPVEVALYDVRGRRVRRLYDGTPPANSLQQLRIEAGALPSGVYFVRVLGADIHATTRAVLVR